MGNKSNYKEYHYDTKSAFVAIVGRPNVGKSSLMNKLVGEKIAIVSNKPQTTRNKIMGVLTKDETQFVFIDTPGLHNPKNKLSEYMVKQINESVADVDAAVLVVDAEKEIGDPEKNLIENMKRSHMPAILAINKIDLIKDKTLLMAKIQDYMQLFDFDAVVPISALHGQGVDELLDEIEKFAEESPHFFPDDTLTDQPERVIAAEIIREKILRCTYDEIPHGTAVVIDRMKERKDKPIIDIDATILCERESHKGMIIGKQGQMLKKIGSFARADLESFLDIKINLTLWVKVKEDWRNRETVIKNLGFE